MLSTVKVNGLLVLGVVLVVVASLWLVKTWVWTNNLGEDDLSSLNGLDTAEIPANCEEHRHDPCALFKCMVDSCWCFEGYPGPVLYEGNGFVLSEAEARYAMEDYLESRGGLTVKNAVKLNEAFYNVFAEDVEGNEETFTVAADGSIIKTICGV